MNDDPVRPEADEIRRLREDLRDSREALRQMGDLVRLVDTDHESEVARLQKEVEDYKTLLRASEQARRFQGELLAALLTPEKKP